MFQRILNIKPLQMAFALGVVSVEADAANCKMGKNFYTTGQIICGCPEIYIVPPEEGNKPTQMVIFSKLFICDGSGNFVDQYKDKKTKKLIKLESCFRSNKLKEINSKKEILEQYKNIIPGCS